MKKKVGASNSGCGGFGFWMSFGSMYLFTSDTVEPIGKLEFFWRMLAGPFNFLPGCNARRPNARSLIGSFHRHRVCGRRGPNMEPCR